MSIQSTPSTSKPSFIGHPLLQSKWAVVAVVISYLAAATLLVLGSLYWFGPLRSLGFDAAMGGGGLLTLLAVGGAIAIKLSKPEPINLMEILSSASHEKKSQKRAKTVFSEKMRTYLQSEVSFPRPPKIEGIEDLVGELDQSVFCLNSTTGVQFDIPEASHDAHHLHVFQVASQYNAAEASRAYTPELGTAMRSSGSDNTQGPNAQRTNPTAFEFVLAFLTHLGFNMLAEALPSAGRTDEKSAIEHGYLRPSAADIESLTEEFKQNYEKTECVCYSSLPKEGGPNSVFILLQAAPAISHSGNLRVSSDELQKYAALANYLALFQKGIELTTPEKPVILHVAAVGGGDFGNKAENLQWGFEKAALALQGQMKEAGVSVQLDAFKGGGPLLRFAQNLNIPKKEQPLTA